MEGFSYHLMDAQTPCVEITDRKVFVQVCSWRFSFQPRQIKQVKASKRLLPEGI